MPQDIGYNNFQQPRQRQKRQTFNWTSAGQNAISSGLLAGQIHPLAAIPGALIGGYIGGKSGPFEPSASDYQPFRNAYANFENNALQNLRAGVNTIGQQSMQRGARQGLYGSPLLESIIQNNQNYTLQSGLSDLNQQRYQFETGLAQNQFNAQQAYDQQMQQQWIGTLNNILTSAPGFYQSLKNTYFQPNPNEYISREIPTAEAADKGLFQRFARLATPPDAPVQGPYRPKLPNLPLNTIPEPSDRPDKLPNIPQAPQGMVDPEKSKSPDTQLPTALPPQNTPEGTALSEIDPKMVEDIERFFGGLNNLLDFDAPLQGMGQMMDRAMEQTLPAPTHSYEQINPNYQQTMPVEPQLTAPDVDYAPPFGTVGNPENPYELPAVTTVAPPPTTLEIARQSIRFGEAENGIHSMRPTRDTKGYTIGWGRNLQTNGMDIQEEIIPILRSPMYNNSESVINHKLSKLGINPTQTGKVQLTPRQFNTIFRKGISKENADMLFENDLSLFESGVRSVVGENVYNSLTPNRQSVLIDMMYTLGFSGLSNFTDLIRKLQAGDYAGAAAAMRNSGWYQQVKPRRADPLIAKMIGG